ncbi:MFS siderochrome iron transporter 1 [Colletotrichum sp. SAR11_59]|nr:MFS siderochrome iron transporter 1 [Colletotrichum sp. SAR11_59]
MYGSADTATMKDLTTQKKVDTDAPAYGAEDISISSGMDILENEGEDPVLAKKMHLVNDANDEIGWTPFHWKLFMLNGFGYAVDSLIALVQSVTNAAVYLELASPSDYVNAGTVSFPNLVFWAAFVAISAFGAGGNLVLDPTVFLEFLPSNKQWTVTALALWWGLGQAVVGFISWGFLTQERWNCVEGQPCNWSTNAGWRYVSFTSGAFVFVASILRVTIMRLQETPKYLLSVGRDEDLVRNYQKLAQKYNKPCSLTLEKLEACGQIKSAGQKRNSFKFVIRELGAHVKGLFVTKKMSRSTSMVWMSWTLIGLAYPLFYVFLPSYLSTRVPDAEETPYETWRNFTLTNISGVPGPILAGILANIPKVGRKHTMVIGAIISMALFFGYTAVSTPAQNVGISCAIAFGINIYYGTLYAYTVEVFPSAHRATGNGIAVAFNRLMGIVSAFVASSGNTASAVPLYVCAALFGLMAVVSALFPFEPYGRRSS